MDDKEEECNCWIISGYGVDGVCSFCLERDYIKKDTINKENG